MNPNPVILVVAAVATLVFVIWLVIFLSVFRLWLQALLTGTPVGIMDIIGMRLRRIPPELVVHTAIMLKQNGVPVPVDEIQSCYLALGGEVTTPTELATRVLELRKKKEL